MRITIFLLIILGFNFNIIKHAYGMQWHNHGSSCDQAEKPNFANTFYDINSISNLVSPPPENISPAEFQKPSTIFEFQHNILSEAIRERLCEKSKLLFLIDIDDNILRSDTGFKEEVNHSSWFLDYLVAKKQNYKFLTSRTFDKKDTNHFTSNLQSILYRAYDKEKGSSLAEALIGKPDDRTIKELSPGISYGNTLYSNGYTKDSTLDAAIKSDHLLKKFFSQNNVCVFFTDNDPVFLNQLIEFFQNKFPTFNGRFYWFNSSVFHHSTYRGKDSLSQMKKGETWGVVKSHKD